MKRIITCLLVVIFAIASSYAQQSTKDSPGNGGTATDQPQQPAGLVQVPASTVTQAAPVGQVVAHQPEAQVLQNHARPEKPDDQDYKLSVFGIHIKLDSLFALIALVISGLAYSNSRSTGKEANRIANEALSLAKAANAAENRSDVRWAHTKLEYKALYAGDNLLRVTIKNFGKVPARIDSFAFSSSHSAEDVAFSTVDGQKGLLAPDAEADLLIQMTLSRHRYLSITEAFKPLLIQAFANISDQNGIYTTTEGFEFNQLPDHAFRVAGST